jgi:TFIIF-interacting CTD phosphatase-like protein
LVAQGPTQATTTSLDISDITEHSADLRRRITSSLAAIPNPLLRHTLQQELETLIPQLTPMLLHDSTTSPKLSDCPASRKNTHVKLVRASSKRNILGTIRVTNYHYYYNQTATQFHLRFLPESSYNIYTASLTLAAQLWLETKYFDADV